MSQSISVYLQHEGVKMSQLKNTEYQLLTVSTQKLVGTVGPYSHAFYRHIDTPGDRRTGWLEAEAAGPPIDLLDKH